MQPVQQLSTCTMKLYMQDYVERRIDYVCTKPVYNNLQTRRYYGNDKLRKCTDTVKSQGIKSGLSYLQKKAITKLYL